MLRLGRIPDCWAHAMNRNNFEKILGYAASVALVVVFFAFGPVMLARAVGIILAAGGFYSFLQGSIPYGIEGREPSGEFTGITARLISVVVIFLGLSAASAAPKAACILGWAQSASCA